MTDFYIDPDTGTGSGVGSEADPFQAWSEATMASNNNYYQKAGTIAVNTARIQLDGLSNINIGSYGVGVEPIVSFVRTLTNTGDFIEVQADNQTPVVTPGDTNVWKYNSGSGFVRTHVLLGLGSLGDKDNHSFTQRVNYLQRLGPLVRTFDVFGQWDANIGAIAPDEASLYIYADANPVTKWGTIYYTTSQDPIFHVIGNSTNILIDGLHLKYSYTGVKFSTKIGIAQDNIIIQNCITEHNYHGLHIGEMLGTVTNSGFLNNTIYRAGNVGIRMQGALGEGVRFAYNHIINTGYMEGIGGIYGSAQGSPTAPTIIENNKIDTVIEGIYWQYEGYGLYSEQGTINVHWLNNYVFNCINRAGLHTNGGTDNTAYIGNLVVDSKLLFNGSDGLPNESDNYSVHDNIGYNLFNGIAFNRLTSNGTMTAFIYNNICYSDGAGGTDLWIDADTAGIPGSVTEDHNCYFGFATVNNTGVNNITTDPLFISATDFNLQQSSPCVGAGVQHWGLGPRPSSYYGEPKPDRDIDIGFQSTWSPNHPVNL